MVTEISRRRLLWAGTGTLLASSLAACTNTSGAAGGGSRPSARASGSFRIPSSGKRLPTGRTKLAWVDSGDQKAYFFKPFFAAYHKEHSNITVDYNGSDWTQIAQVIGTGIRQGSAPDVFQLPGQIPIPEAVANGWIGAYDEIVPNWTDVKKRYPPGIFADGVTDFGGKTYAVPLVTAQRLTALLLFNSDYTKRAEVDLNQVISWEDFRRALKKLTKQGDGKYYGVMVSLDGSNAVITSTLDTMAEMAGVHGGIDGINWRTGEYNFTHPISVEAVELFKAIYADGSFFPDSVNLNDEAQRSRMPQGVAAVTFDGPWDLGLWEADNPSFHAGLNIPPQRQPGNIWPHSYGAGGSGKWVYNATTKNSAVVGDIFAYLTTEDAQTQWVTLDRAGDPPPMPDAIAHAKLDALETKSLQLARRYMVIAPEPAVRNPDVAKVYELLQPAEPNFLSVAIGLITGQVKTTVEKALKGLQDSYDKALDDAIAKAQKKGAKVSRDDWTFPDWDPRRPYNRLYTK